MTPDLSDTSSTPEPVEPADENPYYVLRRGEILGPLDLEQLKELIAADRLAYDDFVQQAGSAEWLPVRWLLIPEESQDLEGALAPTWRTLIKWAWLRLRYNLDEQSLSAGWVCLGLAMIGLFLSRWPVLLWAPWAILAFFGGIALYRRNRPGSGISLMIAAALIPGALWAHFWVAQPVIKEVEKVTPTAPIPAVLVQVPAPASVFTPVDPPPPPPLEKKTVALEVAPIAQPQPPVAPASPPDEGTVKVLKDFAQKIGTTVSNAIEASAPASPITAPVAPLALPPDASPNKESASTLRAQVEDIIYVVKTDKGSGSGFVAELQGTTYLITNHHVLAGANTASFTSKTHSFKLLPQSNVEVADDRDLVRIALKLSSSLKIRTDAPIGEPISVYGNPGGEGVVTMESGKLIGTGVHDIEVSAAFIPGNSGGPITDTSGNVLGVATYSVLHSDIEKWQTSNTRFENARRFGVRLNNEVKWTATTWQKFSEESKIVTSIESYEIAASLLGFTLTTKPYAQRFVPKLETHPMMTRTNFRQVFDGQVASYNAVWTSAEKADGRFTNNSGLNRTNNFFRSKIRGQIGNLGNCLVEGSSELQRLTISYSFATPYARKTFLEVVEKMRTKGVTFQKARNTSGSGNIFGF